MSRSDPSPRCGLRRGVDVILDDGFFIRQNRMRFVERSRAAGAPAKIHFIDTPLDVIRVRLDERNAKLPPYNFRIDPDLLHVFADLFEIPSEAEGAGVVVVAGATAFSGLRGRQAP